MNKPYFAKLLPVKGEIKEGDLCTCPHKGKGINVGKGQPKQVIVLFTYTKARHLCKDCTKVKLFLCSRDIQVGDKIHSDGLEGEYIGTPDNFAYIKTSDGHTSSRRPETCFKVIGEISPDATWVKEGDEFDESDIDHGGWVDEDLKTILIKIKGPCGHFH